MGFQSSWIAVAGADLDALLGELGWARTGRTDPAHYDPAMVAFQRGPWAVLFADGWDHSSASSPRRLAR